MDSILGSWEWAIEIKYLRLVGNNGNNNDYVISQFCFTDAFAKEICTTHSDYKSRGEQDTTLASNDNVFGSDYEQFILNTAQNSDGTLLAYHTIQIS